MTGSLSALAKIDASSVSFVVEETWGRRGTEGSNNRLPQAYMSRKCQPFIRRLLLAVQLPSDIYQLADKGLKRETSWVLF